MSSLLRKHAYSHTHTQSTYFAGRSWFKLVVKETFTSSISPSTSFRCLPINYSIIQRYNVSFLLKDIHLTWKSSSTIASTIGVIIAQAPVLETNIERNIVTNINPPISHFGSVPTANKTLKAILLCKLEYSTASPTIRPPMNMTTVSEK